VVARFIGRVVCDPEPRVRDIFAAEVGPARGPLPAALTRALPHLSLGEVAFRYRAMVGLLALDQAGTLAGLQPPGHPTGAADGHTEQLIALLIGAFRPTPAAGSTDPDGAAAGAWHR
jgi:hypothetical protein